MSLTANIRKAALGVAFLLCAGVSMPQAFDSIPDRALIVSAIKKDIDGVRDALKAGASINVRDNRYLS